VRRIAPLVPLGLGTAALGWALGKAGLPSSYLFAALLVGLTAALRLPGRIGMPPLAFGAAQALTGVSLGAPVRSSSLASLAHAWLPVTLVSAATLALSLAAGRVLARFTLVDAPTGALGMVAGGASGIVAMSDELGADTRLVAFMQYLRVLVVVLLTPLLITILFPGHHGGHVAGEPVLGNAKGWLLSVGLAAAGWFAASRVRFTAGTLLAPMILAAAVVLAVPHGEFSVPPLLKQTAFALIGLQVGLRFTAETVRSLGSLLLPVLACIVALLVASFGLAVLLDLTTSASLLDAYLATTPGGLFAVAAVAVGAGANSTFILAVQALRILVMVLFAPVAVRWLTRDHARAGAVPAFDRERGV
jgi:membrane AbrB-like protein